MPRRKAISDTTVLTEAVRVMAELGAAFTLSDVAQRAGVAPATLIQRFGDKQGLIVAAMAQDNVRFAAVVADAPRAVGADAVVDLLWALTPGEDEEGGAVQLLWLRQDLSDPRLAVLARERSAGLRQALAERLPPLAVSADRAARLLEAQWQGALSQWSMERRGAAADHVAESLAIWFEMAGATGDGVTHRAASET